MNRDSATNASLLLRLRELDDKEAWNEFVDRYGPKILTWCRRFSLQESNAADVTQDVLAKMVLAMRDFDYNATRGSFRGWLKTVTANAVKDWARSLKRTAAVRGVGGLDKQELISQMSDPSALQELNRVIDDGHQAEMLREAESRVSIRVKPTTWKAYQLAAIEQRSASEVAKELKMTVSEVYVAKSRVIKMLRETVQALDGTGSV
jgi:RNA polymerase sigma-70 factor (ECF subfamily)